jgi:hypothetical protein
MSLAIGRDLRRGGTRAGDVTVRVTGPAAVDVDGTARDAAADLQVLADQFGPYPWSEIDVVAVSLGPDAGGMEWPGAVWINGLADGPGAAALTLDHELAHQWYAPSATTRSGLGRRRALAQYSMCRLGGDPAGRGRQVPLGKRRPVGGAVSPTSQCATADDRPAGHRVRRVDL